MHRKKSLRTRFLERLFILDFHNCPLVGNSGDKLVVNQLENIVFDAGLDDQVCYRSRIGESGDVLADLIEGENQVLGQSAGKLGFGFIADDHDGRVALSLRFVGDHTTRSLADRGVNTTTKTLVGGDNDEELALGLFLRRRMLIDL